MFGTLKPHPCSLDERGRSAYGAFYCGLCKALGEGYDTPTRALLSHDAVFLAILADALADEGAAPSSCRCPMMPVVHRPTRAADSPALRFAASAQMLLADQLLADRAIDGRAPFRVARRLLSGKVVRARGLLAELGVDLGELEGFELRQAGREASGAVGEVGPDQAAEPTAEALSLVFGRLAELPGLGFRARSGAARRALRALGRSVGRVIYLLDALDDLRDDHLEGSFNPCLEESPAGPRPSRALVEACVRGARDELAAIRRSLAALPLRRHRRLLEGILIAELSSQARSASARARAWASPAGVRHLEERRKGVLARGSEAALLALSFLWTWLWALPEAFAQTVRRPPRLMTPPDAGAKGPGGHGGLIDGGHPALVPDGGLSAPALDGGCDAGPDAQLDGGCDDGGAGSLLDAGLDAASPDAGHGPSFSGRGLGCPCTELCNVFIRCLDSIGGCFKECGGCLEKCVKCGDGCSSCDPGSGCKPDKCCDCGSCCKGLDCGSCCKGCDPGQCCSGLDCCKGGDCGGCCKGGDCGGCCKGCASSTDGGCPDCSVS